MLTRFAPAPTGALHLGHVANAIYVWGLGRALGAEVLLRIEDHDRQRSRPEYEAALLDDLDWLGFRPDRFPTSAFRAGRCDSRQQDRVALYTEAARALAERDLVYACACSRLDWTRARPDGGFEPGACPRRCRERTLPLRPGLTWRVMLAAPVLAFDDVLCGPVTLPPSGGDPAIRDRHGNWSYLFAVSVDDRLQEIDLVIRGRDLLASTGQQIEIGALVGRPRPARFAHHPLIMKSATQKLSKADRDTGIADARRAGRTAEQLIGAAAATLGLLPPGEALSASEVAALFARPAAVP